MAIFCIPKNLVDKLKSSALRGEVDIKKLYKMSSEERRSFFAKHTDERLGKFINTEFEKAMVSKQKTALSDWAESVFDPKEKTKPVYQNVLDKINSLDELGVLSPKSKKAFLQDLAADKLGVSVTPDEVALISEKAKNIATAQKNLGTDIGNPAKLKENLAFFEAKAEMDKYLQSLAPASKLKVLTGTFGRGMMLASIKSPALNIGSNVEVGLTEAIARRLARGQVLGTDNKLALDYIKMVNKVYQKTGYDLSRMTSISDSGASGARVLGDTVHSRGKGVIRKSGQIVEDIVFKQLMGAPDVAFASTHFADSVNLNARRLAKGDITKAREYMNDAMRLEPQTAQGEVLRQQGIADAQKATWTNKSWASSVSEGIRKIFNSVSGDLRVGDYLFPFVKTPANVIATGIDYAGGGIPKAMFKMLKTVKSDGVRGLATPEFRNSIAPDLVRSGLGITAAAIIAANLDDDDFVGVYDPARAQIEALRNSNSNSIRLGGKWVSVDWLGPLAVPLTSIMYARKYGNTAEEKTFQYGQGVASQLQNLPGISDVFDYVKHKSQKKNKTLEQAIGDTRDYIIEQVATRLTPGGMSDIAKALDPVDRVAKGATQTIKKKIPFLRESLPEKKNIFGETVQGESPLVDILFGSRVKTDKENPIISEINRVSNVNDKAVNFTDWDKSSSLQLAQFRQKVGETKYNEAKVKYGQNLKSELEKLFAKSDYQKANDDEQMKLINGLDSKVQTQIFKDYDFKYEKGQTSIESLFKYYDKGKYVKSPDAPGDIFQTVAMYGKGIFKDPTNTLKALFTEERLRKVVNNAAILERKDFLGLLDEGDKSSKVDHKIPLGIGGDNSPSNLQVLPIAEFDKKTRVDNYLIDKLLSGELSKKEAQKKAHDWQEVFKEIQP